VNSVIIPSHAFIVTVIGQLLDVKSISADVFLKQQWVKIVIKGKVVPMLNLIKHYAMKAYGGVDV
jgi:hypothetical protein